MLPPTQAYADMYDVFLRNQQGFQSSAAIAAGTVYVGCRDAHLYAIDLRAGTQKWHVDTAGSWVVSSPAVSRGRVFFATSDSAQYHVVDATTGAPAQALGSTQACVFGSPTVAGDTVLLGVLNGTLEARDRDDGRMLWQFRTEAARANLDWVLAADGKFDAARPCPSSRGDVSAEGARRQQGVGSFFSTPLVADGTVYIGSADPRLHAIE